MAELAADLQARAVRRIVLPAEQLDVPLPEIRRAPTTPLPLPTAAMIDEMLWRSALAKLEAAKTCEQAARTVAEARRVQAGRGTRWSEKAVQR